ncbi:hypothetical protein [Methylorubrum zatmanii]
MPPSDSPFARCYDLCEDLHAAIVLERLTYWWTRGTRVLKGTEWRAKPRPQLERECRMTEWQCRKALEVLKRKNLIETSQHIFGHGKAVMHYRMLPRAMVFFGPQNTPVSEDPGMALQGQPLVHNGGMVSKNLYEVSKDTSTKFLDASPLSTSQVSGKDGNANSQGDVLPKLEKLSAEKGQPLFPKKSTPKAPSNAKAAIGAKLGMSAAAILAAKKQDGVFPGPRP